MLGLVSFTLFVVFSFLTIAAFAWVLRGLLGVQVTLPRLFIAALITFSLVSPIINSLPGNYEESPEYLANGELFPAVWVAMLGMIIAILIGMVFLVIAEALVPSNTLPGPIYMFGAARRWLERSRRYAQISWILMRHGIVLGTVGGNRATMRTPEGREEMALKLRDAMTESGVTFVKVGQILSTRRDLLPAEFVDVLSSLQNRAAPLDWAVIEEAIVRNLNGFRLDEVFADIQHEPLASASIAQVHVATLLTGEKVVLKVRRPGIRNQVNRDLDIVDRIATRLERSTSWGRDIGARELSAGFAEALREELDLRVEARNMQVLSAASRPEDPQVPHLYEQFSNGGLLVMECIEGTTLGNLNVRDIPGDHKAMADSIFEALLHQMLVVGTFHADPHPGNIILREDGTLTLLDFGSVGRIDKVARIGLIRFLLAWEYDDPISATDALLQMVDRPALLNERQLERDMGAYMAAYIVPGASMDANAITELFGIMTRNGLTMPPELAAALRTIGTIEGTLTWLVPGYNIIDAAKVFAEKYMKDLVRPTSLFELVSGELISMLPLLQRLPRRVDAIAAAMEEGRFSMNVSALSKERDVGIMRGLLQELLLTMLAAASGVMSVLLIRQDTGALLVPGMTVFQFMGYFMLVLAFILAMRVLIFVFRRPE